jgi:hypothetical protein
MPLTYALFLMIAAGAAFIFVLTRVWPAPGAVAYAVKGAGVMAVMLIVGNAVGHPRELFSLIGLIMVMSVSLLSGVFAWLHQDRLKEDYQRRRTRGGDR